MSDIITFLSDEFNTIRQSAFMVLPATAFTAAVEYLGTGKEALITWLVLSTIDCIFGIVVAIGTQSFKVKKMYRWVGRVFLQLLTVFLFAALCHMFEVSAGVELVLTSWVLFFYACLDVSSICNKLVFFGLLPKPVFVILKMLRHRFSKAFGAAFDSPEFAEEIEQALKEHHEQKVSLAKEN